MKKQTGQSIITDNISIIYRLSNQYSYLQSFLQARNKSLYHDLLAILNYVKDKDIEIYNHQYTFYIDTDRMKSLTGIKSNSTANRHINLLAAIGLLPKVRQDPNNPKQQTYTNRKFIETKKADIPINTFAIKRYSENYLNKCNRRAKELDSIGVTVGNISWEMLHNHSMEELAMEVYPLSRGKKLAQQRIESVEELAAIIDLAISNNGYCTKTDIANNISCDEKELELILRRYKKDLAELYSYGRPSAAEKAEYQLKTDHYIYRRR